VIGLVAARHAQGSAPERARPLAPPSGAVVHVSSEAQLQQAVAARRSRVTIVLAPGIYRLTRTIAIDGVTDVVIRGATESPRDVVLAGPGLQAAGEALAPGAFAITGRRITVANLTIQGFPEDAVLLGAGALQPAIYHVRFVDSGRFVAADRPGGVDRGTVELSTFEYSTASRPDYETNAVAVARGSGWIVRNNVFRNIRPPDGGLAGPALSFSDGAAAALIEGNTFVDAQQEIAIEASSGGRAASRGANGRSATVIRNNFIARRAGSAGEAAITVNGDAVVVHNSVLLNGTHRTAIEYRGDGSDVQIANNLVDAGIEGSGGARGAAASNSDAAAPELFVDAARGDLHLSAAGAAALEGVPSRRDAASDWDGDARQGATTLPGADAYASAPSPTATDSASRAAAPVVVAPGEAAQATTLAADAAPAAEAAAAAPALPSPWQTANVGNPGKPGTASYSSSTWTIYGGGKDIWGGSDQFRFVYQTLPGDGDVVARVSGLTYGSIYAKAGVMIRESLSAGARHGFVFVTRNGGIAFRRRLTANSATKGGTSVSGKAPVWLKLSRRGNVVTAYRSANGSSWTTLESATISLPSTAYVGLAVTANDAARTARATVTNVSVTTTGSSTNKSPSVSLTAPASGATYTAPATVTVSASASDSDGTIARVEFYRGSTRIGSDTTAPYSVTWQNAAAGTYSITAVAVDNDGASTTSAARSIVVNTSGSSGTTRRAVFTPSADHASGVTRYQLDIFAAGANPSSATPLAGRDLGKPSIVSGECSVDVTSTINALPAGTYQATVSAIGPGGSSRSTAATFTR
jgi:hypothetical protein